VVPGWECVLAIQEWMTFNEDEADKGARDDYSSIQLIFQAGIGDSNGELQKQSENAELASPVLNLHDDFPKRLLSCWLRGTLKNQKILETTTCTRTTLRDRFLPLSVVLVRCRRLQDLLVG